MPYLTFKSLILKKRMKKASIILVSLFFGFYVQCQININEIYKEEIASGYTDSIIKNINYVKKGLNFCVIGDWGRHGQFYQKKVAYQLGNAVAGTDASFIISTGDNFYPAGVKSVQDPSWEKSFEDVYTHHSTYVDWYVVLGNHDYATNPQAEVDYSNISARWKMPSRYYSIHRNIENDSNNTVGIYFIDSSPLNKSYYGKKTEQISQNVMEADSAKQLNWLRSELTKSKDKWKIVVAHHPVYSAGKRFGKTNEMEEAVKNILNQHNVDLFIAGHEHHLEFDQPKNNDTFYQLISGAGSEKTIINPNSKVQFAKSEYGFATIGISSNSLLIQFIDWHGNVIYSTEQPKRNK
jgi:predicted phosphodiesterase